MIPILWALLGVLAGIVVNRAADNLPPPAARGLLQTPRCPFCDSPRRLLEQSGIASFLARRDHCHQCGAPLPLRLPLVEISLAALFAFLATRAPLNLYLVAVSFFTAVLMLIAVIDLEHKLILNRVSLPATALALVLSPVLLGGPGVALDALNLRLILVSALGAAIGYVLTLGIYFLGVLFVWLMNRRGGRQINTVAFGMGDVKLAGLIGALIGFPAIFYVLVYAILLGGFGAIVAILLQVVQRRGYSAFMAIPYGPYLILAGYVFLLFGPQLLRMLGVGVS